MVAIERRERRRESGAPRVELELAEERLEPARAEAHVRDLLEADQLLAHAREIAGLIASQPAAAVQASTSPDWSATLRRHRTEPLLALGLWAALLVAGTPYPGLALALNAMAVRSQSWMLEAAGIGASGPRGALRAQGAALMFGRVLNAWLDDEDEGADAAMAELDRGLSSAAVGRAACSTPPPRPPTWSACCAPGPPATPGPRPPWAR